MTYQVLNKSKDRAEIHIYEDIGDGWFGGVSAKTFTDDIKKLGNVSQIDVRINSPGGSVFEGVTIYNILKSHAARVAVYIDGLAASIASVVAMAGDEINMADNALMMIHDPWTMVAGSSEELRKEADLLDVVRDTLVETYAKRTSQSKARIIEMMAEETWMTAREAVGLGFADNVTDQAKMAASLDVSRYKYKHLPDSYSNKTGAKNLNAAKILRLQNRTKHLKRAASRSK